MALKASNVSVFELPTHCAERLGFPASIDRSIEVQFWFQQRHLGLTPCSRQSFDAQFWAHESRLGLVSDISALEAAIAEQRRTELEAQHKQRVAAAKHGRNRKFHDAVVEALIQWKQGKERDDATIRAFADAHGIEEQIEGLTPQEGALRQRNGKFYTIGTLKRDLPTWEKEFNARRT